MNVRIFRAPDAKYYGEDILDGPAVYTDQALGELRAHGFTGIWLRARLRDVAQTDVFPNLGANAASYRDALNTLSSRASRYGIGVYLYLNEPLCFPADDPFWDDHPDVRGASGSSGMDDWDATFALCTSHPGVQTFLRDASADLFRHCPKVAGVFTITASEHHTHCYSHNMTSPPNCPRCAGRALDEVIADVNNLIHRGIRSTGSTASVIAWAWGWNVAGDDIPLRIIERLDQEIAIMEAFEMGGRKTILGRERDIDEYSLSYVGPSDRFMAARNHARACGHGAFAKLQIGTTHEIATVNSLPLIPNLLAKARWLRQNDVDGALLCWNFGNRLTLNTWAFNRFLDDPELLAKSDDKVLSDVVCAYLGVDDPAEVLAAWSLFVRAFDSYPFSMVFLYFSPVNYAPVYPLPRPGDADRPMQWTWIPLKRPFGTRLTETVDHNWGSSGYTLEECRDAFKSMALLFGDGVSHYRAALEDSSSNEAQRELRNAQVVYHILRSTANIYDAYCLARAEPFDRRAWLAVADDEAENLEQLLPLLVGETEIGYHSEAAAWFFTYDSVKQNLDDLKPARADARER